ncbi:MAG: glycosyltransferase [Pelagibacterales bacterium]|nr:glycosyltransferase [Pelagibacterales bacterium]
MSKEFVSGTLHKYDWVQLGAAVKHPDHGKVIDISKDAAKDSGVEDAYLKIYAHSGYGNSKVLQEIIMIEKPDAILHFTDPRFWGWLYQMEHEIRQNIPIMYYNIWDDLPYPHWNEPYYESCDLIMNISRQTNNIVKNVLQKHPKPEWAVQWVPHGVNEKIFYPITGLHVDSHEYNEFKDTFKQTNDVDFIIFWNNRNIRRKQPADLILSYKTFCDKLSSEEASKCALFMHTQIVDSNGTDLIAVKNAICPDYKIIFSDKAVDQKHLNFMYNMADVTLNIASNEGFGISWCESLHSGTPIINNVTGGLQDGCRFEDENGDWIKFTTDFPTNHDGTYKKHGIWVKPVFPSNRSLQGSPITPYIFDDRVDFRDVVDAIKYWYDMPNEEREECGLKGHDWVCGNESNMSAKGMSRRMLECIEDCFEKWEPRKRFTMYKIGQKPKIEKPGVIV